MRYYTLRGITLRASGAAIVFAANGSHAHNVTISSVPAPTHGIPTDAGHTHTVTVATMPPFYALAFIMKV